MKNPRLLFKAFVCLLFLAAAKKGLAQNVGVSSSGSFTPDASAGLDVSFTNKGLLIPRVALTATNAAGPIASPTTSLLVYNTATAGTAPNNVIPGYYYWNGVAWTMLSTTAQTATSSWSTTGNAGTSYPTNYLGTTDNFGLHFKTAATHRFWIDSLGSVAVGLNPVFAAGAAREKFLVDAGANSNNPTPTGAFNIISGKGYLDSYIQLNIQNLSPTANASSDIVTSNDAATEAINYVDLGINSSGNTTTGVLGGANTAYLLATGNDFAIGNGSANKNLILYTAGTATTPTNTERMRIDASGNVGIGNTTPTQKLDVTGNLKFSGALMPNNTAGTAGYLLMSNGNGVAPTWFNAATAAWATTGNAGTTAGTNFLGTTDAKDFVIKTNNAERARISSGGDFSIGGTAFNATNPEQLLVDAGTTSSFNVISGKGNLNNYLQLNIQNNNAGTNASSDVVATADNGSETANYVDMGINSSANTAAFFGGINDAYLYNSGGTASGGNLFIGTSTSGKVLGFLTGGGATTNERMRIDGSGNVGIGTITPTQKLDVNGTIVSSTTTYPNYTYNASNRIAFGESFVPTNETGSVINYGSGSNTRNMVFAFSKTSVNTSFLGNDGSQTMIGSEGTANPITFRTGLVYNAANIIGSGTEAMRITAASNVGIGTTTPATKLHVFGANPLTLSGVVTGTSTSADSLLTITSGLVRKLPISTFTSTGTDWLTTGNAGTTAGTNFIGTTDAVDFVLKANNVERMRIVNGSSSVTGTTGDITVGDANSGTLRSNKEMVLRQDGDQFGPSTLRLRNRSGQNGAVFETTGGSANLVDLIFNTGPVATPISSNIRFETRSGSMKVTGNTTEWQFGQPDTNNGGPTLIVGASGNGSNSAIRTGNFAIGATTFNSSNPEKLLVDASSTSSYNVISGRGNLNNYLQLNIQNSNTGSAASSDVVATADNGSETVNYVDMGINSSGNTAAYFGGANDAYLYNAGGTTNGGNLFIGTSTSGKILGFMTGGGATANERMRIDGSGNVGIATTAPLSTLDINGSNGAAITTTSTNITLDATNYTVILTSGTPTVTLPSPGASTNARRIYVIVNETSAARTISSYISFSASTSTTINANSSITVQSNGTSWYRIQ